MDCVYMVDGKTIAVKSSYERTSTGHCTVITTCDDAIDKLRHKQQ